MPFVVRRKSDGLYIQSKRVYYEANSFTDDINNARIFKSKQGALSSNADLRPRNPAHAEWVKMWENLTREDRLRIRHLAPESRRKYECPSMYLNVLKDEYELIEVSLGAVKIQK